MLKVWDVASGRSYATLIGHVGAVRGCAVTPNGKYIVSASEDGAVKLWDALNGRVFATLEGHAGSVHACAVTPDGRRAISASEDGTLKVWDLERGRSVATLRGHAAAVLVCAVAADGRHVVSASADGVLKAWDLENERALATVECHPGEIETFFATADGRLVSASRNGTLEVWDVESGRVLATLEGHDVFVSACAVTRDGRRLWSGTVDGVLKVWDLERQVCLLARKHANSYTALAAGKRAMVAGDSNGDVWFLDPALGQEREPDERHEPDELLDLHAVGQHRQRSRATKLHEPDDFYDDLVLVELHALEGAGLRRLDLSWTGPRRPLDRDTESPSVSWRRAASRAEMRVGLGLLCVAQEALPIDAIADLAGWTDEAERGRFLRVGQALLFEEPVSWDGRPAYRLRDEAVRSLIAEQLGARTLRAHHATLAVILATWPPPATPAARRYALRHALTHRVEARAWDAAWRLTANMVFLEAKCREQGPHEVEAEVARMADRRPSLGEAERGQFYDDLARALARESGWLRAAPEAVAPLVWNRLRCSGWSAGVLEAELQVPPGAAFLRVRHVAQRARPGLALEHAGHARSVSACAVSEDGRLAVSASSDGTLKVWDPERGQAIATFEGHAGGVNACAVTESGHRVVSASEDGTLRIWDAPGGLSFAPLKGHAGPVTACAVSTQGQCVISGSDDGTLKVWSLRDGRVLATLEGHTSGVRACAVSADGRRVVSTSYDRTLKVWDAERGRVIATLDGPEAGGRACAVTPDGRRAVSASVDRTVRIWDLERGALLAELDGHADEVLACAVTLDGWYAISTSGDRTIKVWDLDVRTCVLTHRGEVAYTAVAAAVDTVVAGDAGGGVWFLDWPSPRRTRALRTLAAADWAEPGPVLRAVDGIARVASLGPRELDLDDVRRLSRSSDLRGALGIAEYLASERVGLLHARFRLACSDGWRDLSDEAVQAALQTGALRDPKSGELVDDWSRRVVPSYRIVPERIAER